MKHFAQINSENKVIQVVVTDDYTTTDTISLSGTWVEYSTNFNSTTLPKNPAGITFTYDSSRNAFISPKLFASWVLNEETCQWQPPIDKPTDSNQYYWNESTVSWAVMPT
jgi:hypothetical protein